MTEVLVIGKKISEMGLVNEITGEEKIPTGVVGDKAVTTGQLLTYLNNNGVAQWGRIGGDIANQADLQNQFTQQLATLQNHIQDQGNPHNVAKDQVGLGNVDNTSDLNKPISTAVKEKLDYFDENGAALPYKDDISYEEGAVVVKDGELQQWKGGVWRSAVAEGLSDTIQTFNTPEAGVDTVTGVADGAYFNVLSSSDELYAEEYQNVGGVPMPTGRSYPSGSALTEVKEAIIDPVNGKAVASKIFYNNGKSVQQTNDVVFNRIAHIKDFGAIGDGTSHPLSEKFTTLSQAQAVYPFATSLTQQIDMCAFQLMVNTYPNNCILNFTGMSLYAGSFSRASPCVLIDSPVNMQLIGNGCITSGTTADQRAVCYAVKNPNNFKAFDFEFTDPNFDVDDSIASNRAGYYGFAFFADSNYSSENPCGDIEITGKVKNSLGFAICEGTKALGITENANSNAIKKVRCRYEAENAYYGFSTIYGSVHNDVKGICRNVKRGFISYGTNNSEVDLSLWCKQGFVGSNAFVELAQEGEANPIVHDISIKLNVSGCEAHTRYVSFYHQQPEENGLIYNVDAFVMCDNLTSEGKAPTIAPTNIFAFVWHNGTAEQSYTNRLIDNIKLDCLVRGAITGRAFTAPATPLNKTGRLFFGNGLCEALDKNYISLGLWTNFKVLSGSISVPFLTPPAINGATTIGSATYSTQKGIVSIRDGQAFYNIDLVWTAHTGEGFAVVSGLPVRAQSNLNVGQTPVSVQDVGFLGIISAIVGTAGLNQLVLYSKDTTTGLNSRVNIPTAGAFKASFNFSLYN